jgi:hypothetical protein
VVRVQPVDRVVAVPDQRIVGAGVGAMDVARGQRAAEVIFRDQRIAVVEEPGRSGADDLVEPSEWIVAQCRHPRAARCDQPVLDVIGERRRAVARKVPLGGRIGCSSVCDARKAVAPRIGLDWWQLRNCHRKPDAGSRRPEDGLAAQACATCGRRFPPYISALLRQSLGIIAFRYVGVKFSQEFFKLAAYVEISFKKIFAKARSV